MVDGGTHFEADGQAARGKGLLPVNSPLPRRELHKALKKADL